MRTWTVLEVGQRRCCLQQNHVQLKARASVKSVSSTEGDVPHKVSGVQEKPESAGHRVSPAALGLNAKGGGY